MADWVYELKRLIEEWMASAPGRTVASLHRLAEKRHTISYGTVNHATNGDHEVSLSNLLILLNLVVPTKQGRKTFIDQYLPDYADFSKEYFEGEESIKGSPPFLSKIESRIFFKLMTDCSLPVPHARSLLGQTLYSNFLAWLAYYRLGKVVDEMIVTSGPHMIVEDFGVTRNMTIAAIDEMNPSRLDGDLLVMVNGKTTSEVAKECWHLQQQAHKRCEKKIKANPGQHAVLISNVMKFD